MTAMRLHFKKNEESKKLTVPVYNYLRHRFMLQTNYLDQLRCFETDGQLQERPVRRIRVFDPMLAKKSGLAIRTHADLEAHPEVLAFEGHIDAEGGIYFTDRRTRRQKQSHATG